MSDYNSYDDEPRRPDDSKEPREPDETKESDSKKPVSPKANLFLDMATMLVDKNGPEDTIKWFFETALIFVPGSQDDKIRYVQSYDRRNSLNTVENLIVSLKVLRDSYPNIKHLQKALDIID